jgi:prepilin-type N-terminal cleavage/methylation domain-containing protein
MSTSGPRSMVSGPRADERGFTLMEVMVSALLLLIIMAGFIPVFLSGLASATRERYRSIATNLAQERMEQIRQLDYREIGDATALAALFAANGGNDPVVRGAAFHVSYEPPTGFAQEYQPTGASQALKQVWVTVTWGATPAPSPIVVSTMIDQMYLGPRGSWLEITPAWPDPAGTPFQRVMGSVQVKYHVARADWGMVLNDVSNPGAGVQNVYMRLAFADDFGVMIAAGDPAHDNKIDNTHLHCTTVNGVVTDVYFRWDIAKIDDYYGQNTFGDGLLPDGYWDTQAAIYNAYDQPGNVWQLRVRIMGDVPGRPELIATPVLTADGWSQVLLTWTPGAERDRDHFVVTRTNNATHTSTTWTLDNLVTALTDTGSVSGRIDPWGDASTTNTYQYKVHAVDYSNISGPDGTSPVQLPPTTTTTAVGETTTTTVSTTTTTAGGTTTTTAPVNWVQLVNNTNQSWDVTIKDASNHTVWSGTVAKNTIQTVTGLAAGEYSVAGSGQGKTTISASFSMPAQAGKTVLTIN